MSNITAAAELDAAIAELELDETDAGRLRELVQEGAQLPDAIEALLEEKHAAEPPPAPADQAEEPTGEPSEKQLRALDRETTRHEAKVREIMGAHVAGFTACEKCDGLGLQAPGPQPRTHEYFKPCPTCNGYGEVYTGSLRPGRESRDCPACGGSGYLEALDSSGVPLADGGGAPAVSPLPPPSAPAAANGVTSQPPPAPPTFGRPAWMGDPSIGQ